MERQTHRKTQGKPERDRGRDTETNRERETKRVKQRDRKSQGERHTQRQPERKRECADAAVELRPMLHDCHAHCTIKPLQPDGFSYSR